MRTHRLWLARAGLTLGVAALTFVSLAVADEVAKKPAVPAPQKVISQPFLESLVGSWTTESTGMYEGKEVRGTGKATFAKGIGDTALLQTYQSTGPAPDGTTMTYHGHGVYKASEDGKLVTVWWFCNMSPDVMKLSGSLTDSGLQVSGTSPTGGRFELSAQKSPDGLSYKISEDGSEMKETYKRAD